MNVIKKNLGLRIRELRKSKKITQEQLAEKLGIGVANISYIENGKFAPSMETFEKLVGIFGVEPSEFYNFSNTKTPEEMKKELFSALESDTPLLRTIYKIFVALR